jgi:hypothetical protein
MLEQHPLGGIGDPGPPGLQDGQRLLAAGGQPGELIDAAVGDQRQLLVRQRSELRRRAYAGRAAAGVAGTLTWAQASRRSASRRWTCPIFTAERSTRASIRVRRQKT